jgi:2-polyprenyl-6-methoxyphenol hydroxylase-like FAD-dependent oxidoreductase
MEGLKIAVIGAGISGLAASSFFKINKNSVTLFEKFDTPKPVGAGLLIQPTKI